MAARGNKCFMTPLFVMKSTIKSKLKGTATARDAETKYLKWSEPIIMRMELKELLSSEKLFKKRSGNKLKTERTPHK